MHQRHQRSIYRRILVIRSGGLGDFVLTLPLLRALRRECRGSQIEILGNPSHAELALRTGYADAAHSIHSGFLARCFTPGAVCRDPELAAYFSRFDLVLSFLVDPVLEENLQAQECLTLFISPPHLPGVHAVDHFAAALESVGIAVRDRLPRLPLAASDRLRAQEFLKDLGMAPQAFRVALHPGSGGSRKNWPAGCFASLCRRLSEVAQLLLVSGEADAQPLQEVQSQLDFSLPVLDRLPLWQLAALLGACQAYVGNDSGVSHLAAAVGTPVLALFGPTDPAVWGPRGPEVRVMSLAAEVEEVAGSFLNPPLAVRINPCLT